jgi:hypothetical protein
VGDPLARLDELRRRRLDVLRTGGGDRLFLPLIPHYERHIVSLELSVGRQRAGAPVIGIVAC